MHNFKQLQVWQMAMSMVKDIYVAISNFPPEEKYGLAQQLRRSAVSIPSNIAEGSGRNSAIDFARFLSIANGSAYELETHLIICQEVGLLSADDTHTIQIQLEAVQKMITKLIQKFSQNK